MSETEMEMDIEISETPRRRRTDKHPLLVFLAKAWIGIATFSSVSMAAFLALGFQFQTPASWLERTNARINSAEVQLLDVKESQREMVELMKILARESCSKFTREQLRVTPKCDEYVTRR